MRIVIEDAETVAKYRREIRHRFDPDYFNSRASMAKRFGVPRWLFEDIEVEGLENIEEVRDKQLFFVSNHRSLADFLVQPFVFWENNLPIPRIIAGANLNKFPFKNLWKKCGAISLDRSKVNEKLYLAAFYDTVKESLESGESLLVYPEGTRNREEGVLKFKTGVIHIALDVAGTGKNIFAVPSYVDYDNRIEEDVLNRVGMWKTKKKFYLTQGDRIRARICDYLCFYSDYMAYLPRFCSENKGKAYLRFGKAFPIKEFDKTSLTERLSQEVVALANGKL